MAKALSSESTLQNGKYKIVKVLGQGSFGITYLATFHTIANGKSSGVDVAINVAIKEFFMNELNNRMPDGVNVETTSASLVRDYRERFRKEAQTLKKLHHANIVRVLDVFDENNTTYFVMEYIEGMSVNELIQQKGHLSEPEAVSIVYEIGVALEYMHNNQMLHLDLKPGNMMRRNDGKAFLIDFGLSKVFDNEGKPETSTTIGNGTPPYCPSEQHDYKQSGEIPFTLDVYALGASLFKMLCGEAPPYASEVFDYGLPVDALQEKGVSKKTISAVKKAMEPRRKNRFQTVNDFLNALPKRIKNVSDPIKREKSEKTSTKVNYPEEDTIFEDNKPTNISITNSSIYPIKLSKRPIKVAFMFLSYGHTYLYEFEEDKVWITKKTTSSNKQRCYSIKDKGFASLKRIVTSLKLKHDSIIQQEDVDLNEVYDIEGLPEDEQRFHLYEYPSDGREVIYTTIARKGIRTGGNIIDITPLELDKMIQGKLEGFCIEENEVEIGKDDDDFVKNARHAILWLILGLLTVAVMIYISISSAKNEGWTSLQTIICIISTIMTVLFFIFYIGVYAGVFGWLKILWNKII